MVNHKYVYFLLPAAFALLYHEVIRHLSYKWMTPEGSHGPLILAVSIYLIWIKRNEIRSLCPEPALFSGGLLLVVGLFMFFAGKIGSTILVQLVSMMPVILGVILLTTGFSFFKAFLLPVGYLIFLTGFIELLLGSIAIYLQKITAWIATLFFKLIGWPVFLNGIVIELPHISLEVVRSCSGISHIVALMALAVPLAYLSQKTLFLRIVLILSALFIGVFANGVRVALIGIYAFYNKGADLHGPYETLYVSFIFFFGMVGLALVNKFLSKVGRKHEPKKISMSDTEPSASLRPGNSPQVSRKHWYSVGIALILFTTTIGFAQLYTPAPVGLKRTLEQFPSYIDGFSAMELDYMDERLRPFSADEELLRRYEDSGGRWLDVYIGYFASQDRNSKIIDSRRDWMHEEVSRVPVDANGRRIVINKTRIPDQNTHAAVYFWYTMDGRIITNQYIGKIATFWNGLFKRRTNAAVIVIATKSNEIEIMPLIADIAESVGKHL